MKTKPFNLEEAQKGKPIVTRDGKRTGKYVGASHDRKFCLSVALSDRFIIDTFTIEGSFSGSSENPYDLLMLVEPKKGWVNVYPTKNTSVSYSTRQEADKYSNFDRIACIEYTEGQGLEETKS